MSGWIAAVMGSSKPPQRTAAEKRLDDLVLLTMAGIALAVTLFYFLILK